jgi:hypothetical protein
MRMASRLQGRDLYTATILPSANGIKTAQIKGTKSRTVTGAAFIAILTILLSLLVVTGNRTNANANPIDDIKDVICGQDTYFSEPQPWMNGFTALGLSFTSAVHPGAGLLPGGGNVLGVLPGLNQGDASFLQTRHTAYEKYGMSGTNWTVYRGEKNPSEGKKGFLFTGWGHKDTNPNRVPNGDVETDQRIAAAETTCLPMFELIGTYFANQVFGVTKFLTSVSGWVFSNAYDPSWINDLNEKAASIITGTNGNPGLRDALYFPFLNLVIMLGAVYLGWIGLVKKQNMQAAQGFAWMFGATIVGSMLMYFPSAIPNVSNSVVSAVNSAILVGTAGGTVDKSGESNICYTPVSYTQYLGPGMTDSMVSADKKQAAQREQILRSANCTFWQTFVYSPWAVGQWGVPAGELTGTQEGTKLGNMVVPEVDLGGGAKIYSWPLYQIEQQSIDKVALANPDVIGKKQTNWFYVADAVASPEGNNAFFTAWSGRDGGTRLMISLAALVAAGAGLLIVIVLSLSMLSYAVATSILTFLSVIFLLVGAHPGLGRRIALQWAELLVGTVLKRVMIAALLGVVIAFYNALLSDPTNNWGSSIIAIIALSAAVLMYKKTLLDTFGNVSFGGGEAMNMNNSGLDKAKGAALGAAIGGATALTGAGGAMKAAGARPGGSKLGNATRAISAGTKATAAGTMRGAQAGSIGGNNGMRSYLAMRGAKSSVDGVKGKEQSKNTALLNKKEQARLAEERKKRTEEIAARKAAAQAAGVEREAAKQAEAAKRIKDAQEREAQREAEKKQREIERAKQEEERTSHPRYIAQQAAEEQRRINTYESDHAKYQNDPKWQASMEKTYGFTPDQIPNPKEWLFPGYGMNATDYAKDASKSHPRPKPLPEPEKEQKSLNPDAVPKPNGSTPDPAPKPNGSNPNAAPKPNGSTPNAIPRPPASKPITLAEQRLDQFENAKLEEARKRIEEKNRRNGGDSLPPPSSTPAPRPKK